MKYKRLKTAIDVASELGLGPNRGIEAQTKAQLIKSLIREMGKLNLTHQEIADLAGVSRTTITGIVNGSLHKVTIDRLLRILNSIGLLVEFRIKKAG